MHLCVFACISMCRAHMRNCYLRFACECVFTSERVRRCLQYEASSPPRPPYGHLETLICAVCERVRASCCSWCVFVCVCVCLAGHEQCADDVKSPWVAFRRSPARSGNHPVYGPYVKTAQKRAHASSEDLPHKHTHSCSDTFLLY